MAPGWQLGAVKASALGTVDWAVIIAVIALVATVYFNIRDHKRQRAHARMSVRPRITFERIDRPGRAGITMVNRGLGPARIMRVVYFVNGEQVKPDLKDPLVLVDILVNECGVRDVAPTFKILGYDQIVEKSEKVKLIDLEPTKGSKAPEVNATAAAGLRRIGILVVYRSFYEELDVAHTFASPEARDRAIGSKRGKELLRLFPEQPYELKQVS